MGGADWDAWQSHLLEAVVRSQRQDGCKQGSWDPQGNPLGRVGATALLTLCFEAYQRFDHIVAAR
ncbi:MAG: hypothetical protein HY812_09650 [Planctomycetes bacterium]|nr:hypothetical protein [Planctomycetota bacterium]